MEQLLCPECGSGITLEITNPWTGDAPEIQALCDDDTSHQWDENGLPVKKDKN